MFTLIPAYLTAHFYDFIVFAKSAWQPLIKLTKLLLVKMEWLTMLEEKKIIYWSIGKFTTV